MQQSKKSRDTNGSSQKSLEQILHRRLRILEEHNKFVIKQQPVSCKESEERLSHLINETKYRLKLLEASVCHLGYLVNEDDDALRELQEGVTFFSGGCAKKMCWMQDIEDRLHIFQGAEKGNLHLLETTKFWHMIRYAFVYFWKDIEKRLQLFLETNDTIWLLFDSKFLRRIRVRNVSKCTIWPVNDYLELLLIHVRNCLRLPQDRDGWLPKQPLDEETKLRLRHKFHVKLDVWKVRADKLRRLLGKLEDLRKYWPQQYQTSALLKTNPHIRRSKSASHLDQMGRSIDVPPGHFDYISGSIRKAASLSNLQCLVICDLALEAAFPICGIYRPPDRCQSINFKLITALKARDFSILSDARDFCILSGACTKALTISSFLAGSSGERVAMQEGWGHPRADEDTMELVNDLRLLVHVPQVQQPPENALLVFRPEGCPPAYCKIEVTNEEELDRVLNWKQRKFSCTHRTDSGLWLHTTNLQANIACGDLLDVVSGPAVQHGGEDDEYITTLVCSHPHPSMGKGLFQKLQGEPCPRPAVTRQVDTYYQPVAKMVSHEASCYQFDVENSIHSATPPESAEKQIRRHGWPSLQQIEDIIQLPMMLVLVGHKLSADHYYQARLSWSFCELYLISALPEHIRQGYIACKYVLKRFLHAYRGEGENCDGRSRVGSFHLKTVFLHHLQNFPPPLIKSPFCLIRDLLLDLDDHLCGGSLPHFFLSDCDLLERVDVEERLVARRAINAILSDPLSAILTSPTDASQIYGYIKPDTLANAFCQMASNPVAERHRQELVDLLVRLDACRHRRYRWQQSSDDCASHLVVTGRPVPVQLAHRLKEL